MEGDHRDRQTLSKSVSGYLRESDTSGKAGGLICEPLKAVIVEQILCPLKGATTIHPAAIAPPDGPRLLAP